VVLLSDETARARLRAPSEDSPPAQQQPAGGGGDA
jgi:hypothetical protein